MFVKDFRKGFYDAIQHQRVLVLVGFDVDALCACRILQNLFQSDQILYTIVPVTGKEELERAYIENSEGIKHVIMINCGGSIDVIETLQPEECVRFYICDSHRPVDVHNIFNAIQVKLLMKEDEFDNLPEYDDLFREDESDEDSGNDSDGSERSTKRKRFDDDAIDRRRERRLWEEKRAKFLFDYEQFTTYGSSAALIMFELAWKMSKDTNDLLWLAILGVTEQYIHYKTPRDKYIDDVMALQSHVSRHNHRDDENIISINCLKLAFDEELQLSLYRHWSLFESICHTVSLSCKFKVWTLKGQKRLHEFLAEMGYFAGTWVKPGDAMIGQQIAKVLASKNTKYKVGTLVVANVGWRTHAIVSETDDAYKLYALLDMGPLSPSLGLGVLGMPGMTAYFGFLEVCKPQPGETVLVNGAAGAVGSLVGQIAKIKGCKVIGYAGTDDKISWLKELGFDAAYNYKKVDLDKTLTEAAPDGIDCYFDNVGGDFSVTAVRHLNLYGRMSICGSISGYNATTPPTDWVKIIGDCKKGKILGLQIELAKL